MKVILASDDPRVRAWLQMALGPDWRTLEASNGLEARSLAAGESTDLVIADETMAPYGAFGLCRDLKILPRPPAVLIILERAQDAWLAGWAGADRWLVRPVEPFEVASEAHETASAAGGGRTTTEEESA